MLLSVNKKEKPDLWAFDNDGTLYSLTQGLKQNIEKLMSKFIAELYNVSEFEAEAIRKRLLRKHDTQFTLIALKKEQVDVKSFIQKTYLAIDPDKYGIVQNKELHKLISSLRGEKIVITENPSEWATLILKSLGIFDLFLHIYGMRELMFIPKTQGGIKQVLGKISKQKTVVYIDDNINNIQVAKSMGCITVLIGEKHPLSIYSNSDYWTPSLV